MNNSLEELPWDFPGLPTEWQNARKNDTEERNVFETVRARRA